MNLGIILPLAIYLVFIFGAALFAYVKRRHLVLGLQDYLL